MLRPLTALVDPGGMTGIATYERESGRFLCWEEPPLNASNSVWQMAAYGGDKVALGWERFTINATTHKKTAQPAAMEVIGVLRFACWKHSCYQLPEQPQHTPTALEQRQLKAIGWWNPGENDAQSAAAHLMRYLIQERELPPREAEILQALH